MTLVDAKSDVLEVHCVAHDPNIQSYLTLNLISLVRYGLGSTFVPISVWDYWSTNAFIVGSTSYSNQIVDLIIPFLWLINLIYRCDKTYDKIAVFASLHWYFRQIQIILVLTWTCLIMAFIWYLNLWLTSGDKKSSSRWYELLVIITNWLER